MRIISIILLWSIIKQGFSETKKDSSDFNIFTKEGNWLNVSGSLILEKSTIIEAYRFESTYWFKLSKKSNAGIKLGYYNRDEINRSLNYEKNLRTKDIFIGVAYRRNFLTTHNTPFFGIDCNLDYNAGYNHDIEFKYFENDWDWGSSCLLNIGYAYQKPGNHWGYEICYSAGIMYYNNFYETRNKKNDIYERKYYHLIGISNLQAGINYKF